MALKNKLEHFDRLETRPPKRREAQLMAELPRLVAHAKKRAPGFARILADIDPRKVKPTMFRGYPVWGWCFYKAGWKFVAVGKGGKHVLEFCGSTGSGKGE